jgi:hypothetical protein
MGVSRAFAVFERDGGAASAECYAFYTMVCLVSFPGEKGRGERRERRTLTDDNRYGDDGTWSAVSIRVGTPPQWVDVMVNTVSSETWVVGPNSGCNNSELDSVVRGERGWNVGGAERGYFEAGSRFCEWDQQREFSRTNADLCNADSICTAARGSIYDSSKSSTYKELALYSLGVDVRLNGSAYADYGFDALTFGSTGVTLNSTIIGSMVNTTEFLLGMFGLGVVPGSFNNTPSVAAISALVEKNGVIPSNSYGYTAGATYRMPSKSLTCIEMLTG